MGTHKAVIQFDLSNRPMREFPSLHDAARHVNGDASNIYKCCRMEIVSAYGFKWRYAEDKEINDMDYSMILERAFSELVSIVSYAKIRAAQQFKAAKDAGEPEPAHLRLVIDALENVKSDFRKRSDKAYKKHCTTASCDKAGVENLANAVIERMALDYETAISDPTEHSLGMKNEVEYFAKTLGKTYTSLDTEDILDAISAKYKVFKKKAHDNISELITITDMFRKKRDAFSEKHNPYRCPLCGGGMYVKSKMKANSYLVGCTGCNLTEIVTIKS